VTGLADIYARLKEETALLLGLDVESGLSPADEVKVATTAGLRLELDRLQACQLRGEEIDAKQLLSVGEALQEVLRTAAASPQIGRPAAGGGVERLKALIAATFHTPPLVDPNVPTPEQRIETLERENAALRQRLQERGAAPAADNVPAAAPAGAAGVSGHVTPLRPEPVERTPDGIPKHFLKAFQVRDPGLRFYESTSWARKDWSPPRNW
jgi:hypothetical protein